MRSATISITILLIIISLTACNPFEKDLSGAWFYAPSEQRSKNDTLLTTTSFLHLEDNGTYESDLGRYDYGHWTQEADELVLTNRNGRTIRLPIQKQDGRELKLFANANRVVSFDKYPVASDKHNPFARSNNQWRIPATHPESDAELKARLHNHCQFWEMYFAWALEKEVDGLDVTSTPTPLKMYGNGFGLKKYEDLPLAWKGYFYDTADCRKADRMIKDIFRKRNIKWPETEVTYEKFISAFQQLQVQLK